MKAEPHATSTTFESPWEGQEGDKKVDVNMDRKRVKREGRKSGKEGKRRKRMKVSNKKVEKGRSERRGRRRWWKRTKGKKV